MGPLKAALNGNGNGRLGMLQLILTLFGALSVLLVPFLMLMNSRIDSAFAASNAVRTEVSKVRDTVAENEKIDSREHQQFRDALVKIDEMKAEMDWMVRLHGGNPADFQPRITQPPLPASTPTHGYAR